MPLNLEERERIEQLLRNWWLARASGTDSASVTTGGQWRTVAAVPSARCNIPVLIGEAERTDKAMNLLPPFERVILVEAHFSLETINAKAKNRSMDRTTYWRWVTRAEETFWDAWQHQRWTDSRKPHVVPVKPGDTDAPEFAASAPWSKNKS